MTYYAAYDKIFFLLLHTVWLRVNRIYEQILIIRCGNFQGLEPKYLPHRSRMAKLAWKWYYAPVIIIFFFIQLFLILHRAQRIEKDDLPEEAVLSRPIEQLLSSEPVSGSVQEIRTKIRTLNELQLIFNTEEHGGFTIAPDTPVFIIQLHDRVPYIHAIIRSLRQVRGINQSLIIFSHDIFTKKINDIIGRVEFGRVMQIYYPYSVQAYPRGYPGPDPKGVQLPIGFGRTPQLAQIKLHWIWKFTHVFRHIRALANHTGPKIFLEEDHFVVPDILHALNQTLRIQAKDCPTCLIVLGDYPKEHRWEYLDWDLVEWAWFFASGNNMGMVFTKHLADELAKCGKRFCTLDEYNWDWTLQHLNVGCFEPRWQILKLEMPRVFHVGDCGTHTSRRSKEKCERLRQVETLDKVKRLMVIKADAMFPAEIRVVKKLRRNVPTSPDPYGGWRDPRDHSMCLSIMKDL